MNPLIVLTAVFAAACAAPSEYAAPAGAFAAGHPAAHALSYGAVVPHPVAPAPVSVPAPYTTSAQGPATTTLHEQPGVVTKQLHFGQTQFVSGHASEIIKPPTPVLPIAVPTVLLGTVRHNPAVVQHVSEPYIVNEPYPVERRVEVPYDVPVIREQIREVAVPYHVDAPYAVPHPVPVRGEDIVNVRRTAPVVHQTHSTVHAAPALVHAAAPVGYAHAAPAGLGYAHAAPAGLGYAHAAPAALGYAHAAPAGLGYAHFAAAPVAVEAAVEY